MRVDLNKTIKECRIKLSTKNNEPIEKRKTVKLLESHKILRDRPVKLHSF